jgi:hypothetical protein
MLCATSHYKQSFKNQIKELIGNSVDEFLDNRNTYDYNHWLILAIALEAWLAGKDRKQANHEAQQTKTPVDEPENGQENNSRVDTQPTGTPVAEPEDGQEKTQQDNSLKWKWE